MAMSSITKQHMGCYIYLYESTSYWDTKSKKSCNNKICIGKIDPSTGDEYFRQEYIDRLKSEGKQTDNMRIWHDQRKRQPLRAGMSGIDTLALAQEILSTVKSFGLAFFLQSIAEKIGLVDIMSQSIPLCWQRILVLACYLVSEDKPVAYCSDWVDENECIDAGSMASQRISELLCAFGYNHRSEFFKRWYLHIRENEYVALDITSVSSYSEHIGLLGWGHNRDGDRLPQANICMLFGEKSMMPIYQTIYNGSLSDVTTLETTLSEFEAITGTRDIKLVMDKGFSSAKNINKMLSNANLSSYKFLIPVSFTTKLADELVENERSNIDDVDNVIFTSDMPVRGVYRPIKWKKGKRDIELHAHIFYDPESALAERNDKYDYVARLKKLAVESPADPKQKDAFQKYLIISNVNNSDSPISVGVRKDVIEKSLKHSGWLILISNNIRDTQEALDLYRAKDVVEKSFYQYKNNLELYRFRVHSDERTLNKTFVAFIALILSSHIHKVMRDSGLDRTFTFGKLLRSLSKLKIAYVSNIPVLQPLTKEQKLIFKSFAIDCPGSSVD